MLRIKTASGRCERSDFDETIQTDGYLNVRKVVNLVILVSTILSQVPSFTNRVDMNENRCSVTCV